MNNYDKRLISGIIGGLLVAVMDPSLGAGIVFSMIIFGIGIRIPQGVMHDIDMLQGESGEAVKKYLEDNTNYTRGK